ncbi:hypothetical protein QFZ81_000087 [Paenibacillus sp. V4I9]|uniref:BglII/BstYI family type II restriction endonuclease n=1 Tax=Paenibacillus sp. V4I9 TaxID=3042308 RepID=UPI00278B5A28|nr:BglII/BstYI family type II restriction endonuclease [Paenibacillus sp. V4I9]MDQ0884999.1 hypothetical protein [Paenibacillus sp. V4I9]
MIISEVYSHNNGRHFIEKIGLFEEIESIFKLPDVGMKKGAAVTINELVKVNLNIKGWVLDPSVHPDFNLNINAMKNKVGLTVQTGNITRAFYDLLKFQAMYLNKKIEIGVLVVPTSGAARALGSNIANFLRVTKEIILFKDIITIPTIILGIDE